MWTGNEIIVWGGMQLYPNTMATLTRAEDTNPSTDSWIATSTTNAPTGRFQHTAVWTGSEMIVWGGDSPSGIFNTGGRYDPGTDGWTATSANNAPSARWNHTAVWTGSEMIVWGGYFMISDHYLNTGGRYNPITNSWTATSTTNAPSGRFNHTAVWTESEMIVWGGPNLPQLL